MPKLSFDKSWENNIYSQSKQLNKYPYDVLVSIVAKKFFHIPEEERINIKVLDLGCGAGNNAKFLAESGFNVFGIDGSETAIEICQERFKKYKLKGNFICADFLDLPWPDNFFDLVVDRESLSHNCPNDIKEISRAIYKKLKKNGLLISFMFNSFHPDKEFGREIASNTYKDFRGGSFKQVGVVHFVDIKEIEELCSKLKIENIISYSLREIYNSSKKVLEAEEYIIIARK